MEETRSESGSNGDNSSDTVEAEIEVAMMTSINPLAVDVGLTVPSASKSPGSEISNSGGAQFPAESVSSVRGHLSSSSASSGELSAMTLMMFDDQGADGGRTIMESEIMKLPRHSVGFPRRRYMVLSTAFGSNVYLRYYKDEAAFSGYQEPMGEVKICPKSTLEDFVDPFGYYAIKFGTFTVKGDIEYLFFRLHSEIIQKKWIEMLNTAILFRKYHSKKEESLFTDSLRSDDSGNLTDTTEEESLIDESDVTAMEDMDELDLEDMMMVQDIAAGSGEREEGGNDDVTVSRGSRNSSVEELARIKKECKTVLDKITELKNTVKTTSNPILRKHAKKKLKLFTRKSKACMNWASLVVRWVLTITAREGSLPRIRRMLDKIEKKGTNAPRNPHNDKILEGVLPNMARSAARFGHKDLLTFLIRKRGVDVNNTNTVGFSLAAGACFWGAENQFEMLRYMRDELGADVTRENEFGQNLLFFLVANGGDAFSENLDFFVNTLGCNPKQVDRFGCSLLHWAAMYSNLSAIKAIYDNDWQVHSRAKWSQFLDMYDRAGVLFDTIKTAKNGWRSRGLLKFADDTSPLGVAVLHNEGVIAKYLMGMGSSDCRCLKRRGLFDRECADLEMVAIAWPELLPDVLSSFAYTDSAKASWQREKQSGGFVQETYAIQDIIGNPDVPVLRSPLAVLCRTNSPEVFDKPIVRLIIALKWHTFGKRQYLKTKIPYLLSLFSFMIGHFMGVQYARWVNMIVCAYLLLWEEFREVMLEGVSAYVSSVWNYMSGPAYIGILYLGIKREILMDTDDWNGIDNVIQSFAGFALIIRLLEFLSILQSTSLFVVTVQLLVLDIIMWGSLFTLFIWAFASAFYLLMDGEEGHETFASSAITVFRMSIGDFDYPFSEDETINNAATGLWVIYIFLVHLLYLNVLIAMMSKSFERVEDAASGMASLALGNAMVTWEATLCKEDRRKAFTAVCAGQGKLVKLELKEGLGWFENWLGDILFGPTVGKQVVIDDGSCTIYQRQEKDWRQIEEEEERAKEEARKREQAEMKKMVGDMMNEMKRGQEEMNDMMQKMLGPKAAGSDDDESGGAPETIAEHGRPTFAGRTKRSGSKLKENAEDSKKKERTRKRDRLRSIFGTSVESTTKK